MLIKFIKSICAIIILTSYTQLYLIGAILLIFGNEEIQAVLVLLLFYQYFFAKKSTNFLSFLSWLEVENYFISNEIIFEEEIVNFDKRKLFCIHPHGIFNLGIATSIIGKSLFKKIPIALKDINIILPWTGLLLKLFGAIPASKEYFKSTMQKEITFSLYPGGREEGFFTKSNKEKIFILKRKGFVKYCVDYGYTIYPVYFFNENQLYWRVKGFVFGILFLPNPNKKLVGVVGKGICTENEKNVDVLHRKYVEEIQRIFNKYKNNFIGNDLELEIN